MSTDECTHTCTHTDTHRGLSSPSEVVREVGRQGREALILMAAVNLRGSNSSDLLMDLVCRSFLSLSHSLSHSVSTHLYTCVQNRLHGHRSLALESYLFLPSRGGDHGINFKWIEPQNWVSSLGADKKNLNWKKYIYFPYSWSHATMKCGIWSAYQQWL